MIQEQGKKIYWINNIVPIGVKMYKEKLDKKVIETLYYKDRKSMDEIAIIIGCGSTKIYNFMRDNDMPRRSKRESRIGYKHSMATRQKLADIRYQRKIGVGKDNCNYKGGKTQNGRSVPGTTYWRNSVKRRDGYICQECGLDGNVICECCGIKPRMHAHHIESWENSPDKRFDIDNGITLCERCHLSTYSKQG